MKSDFLFEQYREIVRMNGKLHAMFVTTMHGGPDAPRLPPLFYDVEKLDAKIKAMSALQSSPSCNEEIHQCRNGLGALTSALAGITSGEKNLEDFPEAPLRTKTGVPLKVVTRTFS
jgi:hypothetical protein